MSTSPWPSRPGAVACAYFVADLDVGLGVVPLLDVILAGGTSVGMVVGKSRDDSGLSKLMADAHARSSAAT